MLAAAIDLSDGVSEYRCGSGFATRDSEVLPRGNGKQDDTGTRVPLTTNWAGRIVVGSHSDVLSKMKDQSPTLAEIGGVEMQETERDGISFAFILLADQLLVEREWIYLDH